MVILSNSLIPCRGLCPWAAGMAGLIKNQILKHLSKFVKNLSPSQISLSALRGEGELTNLELNVEVKGVTEH